MGRPASTVEDQPRLRAWLQEQQGLSEAEAAQHAQRLVHVFKSGHQDAAAAEQAALGSLPATFGWCRSQRLSNGQFLTGQEVARLLDRMARQRHSSVVNFGSTAQRDWQLLDSYIEAHVRQQQQESAGAEERQDGQIGGASVKLRKRACLADALQGQTTAALALIMPPGHVAAWLAAVGQRLSKAEVGALVRACPEAVCGSPTTAVAAIDWAARELGAAHVGTFCRRAPSLLKQIAGQLEGKLEALQGSLQAAGLAAEQARELVLKEPKLLLMKASRLAASAAWLQQFFRTLEQLWAALWGSPHLLFNSAEQLQGQFDWLQDQLGWDSQRVYEFACKYPQPFATVNLSKP